MLCHVQNSVAFSFDFSIGKFHLGFNSRQLSFGRSAVNLDLITGGGKVSKRTAIRISTVYTCLNILGETVGSLPFDVKQETKKGKVTAYDHPAYKLIHDRPNPFTNAFDFWSTQVKLAKAWGNAYAIIQKQMADPVALWIMPPWDVEILIRNGAVFYKQMSTGRVFDHTEVLHFKNFSLDGINGLSAIQENMETIGHRQKLQQHNQSLVGSRPHGYLSASVPPKDKAQKENLEKMWSKADQGVDEVGGIPLLYGGLEFKSLTLPAEAVAYIDSLKLTNQEIYGIFRIPPSVAQDYERATFSNAEQQDLVMVKHTLTPLIKGIEQECNAKLFREDNYTSAQPYFCKFNLNGLLRGDLNAQKEFFKTMVTNGIYSPNRVLELMDENTYEGGDRRYVQGAMVPVDMIESFYAAKSGGKKSKISKEQNEKLKSKLNGHYQDVMDILQS